MFLFVLFGVFLVDSPLPQQEPIDKFGYIIGQTGEIKVEIDANPKPQIEWQIDGQRIREGANDNTGRIEAENARDLVILHEKLCRM